MFGFLKNKLKEWAGKAKDKIGSAEAEQEKKEEISETKEKAKIEEKPVEEIKKEEEIKEEPKEEAKTEETKIKENEELGKKADVLIEDAKKEEIKEPPMEFNVALQKYEPEIEKIKEQLEIKKEEEPEEKPSFISKLFKKKPKEEIKIEKLEVEKPEEKPGEEKKSFFKKVKETFTYKISEDDFNRLFEDLEMLLLENNVALEATEDLKKILSKKLVGKEIKKNNLESEIKKELKNSLNELIIEPDNPLTFINLKKQNKKEPFVILFFGINGTGKTTSIAKIAHLLKSKGFSVVLAAADTFRAASIEQISEHAKKLDVPLIKHDYQADPAAVGFDAIKYAKSHRTDVVLIDTAGRMHTKINLLSEMEKISRVTNPDLKIFVAESIAGNDATEQAKAFNEMIGIDGSILSKADVDEKGGTIISVSHATHKPIFYLGTGQKYEDLKLFNKQEFIESLGL